MPPAPLQPVSYGPFLLPPRLMISAGIDGKTTRITVKTVTGIVIGIRDWD